MEVSRYYKELCEKYTDRTAISGGMFEKAKLYLAGGEKRTVSYYPPYPLTIVSGKGCLVRDADGNSYIDCVNNYTSLLHGHANDMIANAICDAARKGTAMPAGIEDQVKLAQLLCSRVPGVERIRFCNSGTEATLFATRAAKVYTGKPGIIKILGGYHGTTDMMEYNVSPVINYEHPEEMLIPRPDIGGVSEKIAEEMYIVPYNDLEAVKKVLEEHHNEIAGMILEPFLGAGGVIPAKKEYLDGLRKLTREYDVLLIFDEVQSFRLSTGGAQKMYGVIPDITAFAKIIGGGLPVGAVGGSQEIMDVFNPLRKDHVTQSGTFNGNRATMAAGYAAMIQYDQKACDRINGYGEELQKLIEKAFQKSGIPGCVTRSGSILNYHFLEKRPEDYIAVTKGNHELGKLLHLELLERGVFVAPRGMMALSTAMTEDTIKELGEVFEDALQVMANRLD